MEEVTGKKVQFFPVQSNAAQIEAMRSGRLHVVGFNTGSNPLAVNCAGFVPFTIMASLDGNFGYQMEIITFEGSGINSVEDIKGNTMAFTAPTSNSGFKAMIAWFGSKSTIANLFPCMPCPPALIPVTMLEQLTRVTVGKIEWWLAKFTPPSAKAERFGVNLVLTWDGWSPSNTNINTVDIFLSL